MKFHNDDQLPLLAIRNETFGNNMKGKKPSMFRKVINALKNAEGKGNLVVKILLTKFTRLNCKNCNALFDRDIVGSKNILYLAYLPIIGSNRPERYKWLDPIRWFKHVINENIFGYNIRAP
ncbi:unnamed protein product [Cunninghamella blakesleeana]